MLLVLSTVEFSIGEGSFNNPKEKKEKIHWEGLEHVDRKVHTTPLHSPIRGKATNKNLVKSEMALIISVLVVSINRKSAFVSSFFMLKHLEK